MNALIPACVLEPAVRHARRISGGEEATDGGVVEERAATREGWTPRQSHARPATPPTGAFHSSPADCDGSARDCNHNHSHHERPPPLDLDRESSPQPLTQPHTSANSAAPASRSPHRWSELRRVRAASNPTLPPQRPLPLGDAFPEPRLRSFSRQLNPTSLPVDGGMSENPLYDLHRELRASRDLDAEPSTMNGIPAVVASAVAAPAAEMSDTMSQRESDPEVVSRALPENDGMGVLRLKIHEIWDMEIPQDAKARRMHTLMTERYLLSRVPPPGLAVSPMSVMPQDRPFTPNSPPSPAGSDMQFSSPASVSSALDPDNPYNIGPGDLEPSYRTGLHPVDHVDTHAVDDNDSDFETEAASLGCRHYKRNVKVQCFLCSRWYSCRRCHDDEEDHRLDRRKTRNMLCMLCRTPQPAAQDCRSCGECAAWYYCDICKLWDDDSSKKIYHCLDCGICRMGEGIGKDYVHCKKCNVCITISFAETHRCVERATECDCPICGDFLFNSPDVVVGLQCGHYLHKLCYNAYMNTSYKCPICKKSAVNMELQWQKINHAIESQPMPQQFARTKVVVQCNDCYSKSSVPYHWLGSKCANCDSYNTNELRMIMPDDSNQAVSEERQQQQQQQQQAQRQLNGVQIQRQPSPETRTYAPPPGVSTARSRELRPSGSYFRSDDPTDDAAAASWQSTAGAALENLRGLSPYDMLQRMSRSLSPIRNYLGGAVIDGDNDDSRPLRKAAADVGMSADIDTEVDEAVDFWGSDGRFLSGEEDSGGDGEAAESESEDESMEDDWMEEDGVDVDGEGQDEEDLIDLIGHR